MILLIQLKDIDAVAGPSFSNGTPAEIVARLREHYSFLPPLTSIAVDNGLVTINIPDEPAAGQAEAERLKAKAAQRARQGEYRKAIDIWNRVIDLNPTDVVARRDLGMAQMEVGEIESAKESLIEAALLDPEWTTIDESARSVNVHAANEPWFSLVY